ncbi:MAG TPA: hypothetical protein DCL54_07245 [Alphaproteobacteria bacterium]|nr:hypothetical protein [Alphaproteobacteria bacterium]HAJ46358.1 hypothetical protein [Alphaproteobacteria bacterium]
MQIRQFLKATAGNIAITYAIALAPSILAVGAAVDMTSAVAFRGEMQSAADAAVLAGAAATGKSLSERQKIASDVFQANIEQGWSGNFSASGMLTEIGGGYRYVASGEIETAFAGIAGIETVSLGAVAEAMAASSQPTEFVIAFDVTNSMVFSGSDWDAAKQAVQDFIAKIYMGANAGDVTGTLLPYSDRVRLGDYATSFTTGPKPSGWGGCIEVREQPAGADLHRLTDDPPTANKFTYYTPQTLVENPARGNSSYNTGCHGPEITGPINEGPAELIQAVADLYIGGTGRYDEGMAWAWRLLSPRWKGHWKLRNYPKKADEVAKLAILVSDGRTEIYRYEVLPANGLHNVYGWNMGSPEGFKNLVSLCNKMKDDGIEVHVVALPGNPEATQHFKDCASPKGYHSVTDIASFKSAFLKIGENAGNLRLTK